MVVILSLGETRAGDFFAANQLESGQIAAVTFESTSDFYGASEYDASGYAVAPVSRASSGNGLPPILSDRLVPGQHTLDAAVSSHPALRRVNFSATPRYDGNLQDFGRATNYTAIDGDIAIGSRAFSNNTELIGTLVHEEAHLRFYRRLKLNGPNSRASRIGLGGEEDYVRAVEARFLRMKGLVGGE